MGIGVKKVCPILAIAYGDSTFNGLMRDNNGGYAKRQCTYCGRDFVSKSFGNRRCSECQNSSDKFGGRPQFRLEAIQKKMRIENFKKGGKNYA
jgi:hypothetical protein